ncbi:hypothetical protein DRH29_00930 [candidate division Kazan bacterium]|uniref:Glycosyltransferase family 1 protein n=1 Tax=candidate division Kazan bacterium TaxID=2202143 RepID=A0A420ZD77_UNCK3|nr:MAG: hypothetical protein DRH29_00930 [candidate division Kazan bacterium]
MNKSSYRIGIDARLFGTRQAAGIGIWVEELIGHLLKLDKVNQYIAIMLPETAEFFPFYANNLKKQIVRFPHYTYSEQFLYPRILKKMKLDLIHYTNFNTPIFFKGTKSIVSIYDLTLWFYPGRKQRSWFRRMIYRYVMKKSCENASRIIAISNKTKQDIIKFINIDPSKIDVVYAAAPKRRKVAIDARRADQIFSKHNISRPFFLYVGQWRQHKNLVRLIRAFALLKRQYNLDYQLVLVGQVDEYASEIPRVIKQLGLQDSVITTGYISDNNLSIFYDRAEIFVFPSLYEGFGIPPLEAMSAGTPVISSNASVMPEVLGDAAVYFDPTNIKDMADTMYKVASSFTIKKQLKDKGFKQIKKYSYTKMAREILAIYKKVLAEPSNT